jgi:hypothetical protein
LKVFRHGREDEFRVEKEAFEALSNLSIDEKSGANLLIRCLGHFTEKLDVDGHTEKTHNLLLEYGELDLDEYFAETPPPATVDDIIPFWRNMFNVVDALEFIHNFQDYSGQDYFGCVFVFEF